MFLLYSLYAHINIYSSVTSKINNSIYMPNYLWTYQTVFYRTLLSKDSYSWARFKDWQLCMYYVYGIYPSVTRSGRCSAERLWRLLLRTVAYDTSRCVDAGSNKCCCAYVCVPLGFKAMMKRYRGLPHA